MVWVVYEIERKGECHMPSECSETVSGARWDISRDNGLGMHGCDSRPVRKAVGQRGLLDRQRGEKCQRLQICLQILGNSLEEKRTQMEDGSKGEGGKDAWKSTERRGEEFAASLRLQKLTSRAQAQG